MKPSNDKSDAGREIRVLILVPGFPLKRENIRGGVHAALANLLEGFESMNDISVRVVSFNREVSENTSYRWSDSIEVFHYKMLKLPFKAITYLLKGPGILKKNIDEFQPDIVHYQVGGNFFYTKLFGLKGVQSLVTIHGISYRQAKVDKSLVRKITLYWNALMTKLLIPYQRIHISEYSRNIFESGDGNYYRIIYNAVPDKFFLVPEKKQLTNRLLYVGVINNAKNLKTLLDALLLLKEAGVQFQLDIIGGAVTDHAYFEMIKNYAAKNLENFVFFQGWKNQDEVVEYLANTDVLVLPSRQETLPMSIAEAMAASKVVIATNVGGIPEMIRHGETGYMYEPDNHKELADHNRKDLFGRCTFS